MELTLKIETDEIFDREMSFESLFSESFRKAIIEQAQDKIKTDKFEQFSKLTSETIVANIKLKMENFLSEEIILTGRYGEKDFVGSIEDLIKKRFDDVILRPVDSNGKTLQGCTSSGDTWIEWCIKKKLDDFTKKEIDMASRNLTRKIEKLVNDKLIAVKDSAIKEQINNVFTSILKNTNKG